MWMTSLFLVLSLVVMLLLGDATGQEHECTVTYDICVDQYYASKPGMNFTCLQMEGCMHGNTVSSKCKYLASCLANQNASECMEHCENYIDLTKREGLMKVSREYTDDPGCDPNDRYRLITGMCNNLNNPHFGEAPTTYNRLLPAAFDDGISTPRQTSACGGTLPSARLISNIIHQTQGPLLREKKASYMVMQWGQFLAHDIGLTPITTTSEGDPLECCGADIANEDCFPIEVPPGDPFFDGDCMSFARSLSIDVLGKAEQVNEQTAAIDASNVYGANPGDQAMLRIMGGLHQSIDRKLGIDFDDSNCKLRFPLDEENYYCTKAGDIRVNEQPGLASIHTIFDREHNRIVTKLAEINPNWDDDTLYGEARKIVAAEMQLITYNEWLPVVLGTMTVNKQELAIKPEGFSDTYDETVDLTIDNEFVTAILRFGHSLIHDIIGRLNKTRTLLDTHNLTANFFDPLLYHLGGEFGTDRIINWIASTQCPRADRFIQDSARDTLFEDSNGKSFDLAALNIQRGRDHGLPSYNEYRELCGLTRATYFDKRPGGLVNHDPEVAALLEEAYNGCIDDIDLFVGAITEKRIAGALTGPLQQCLMVTQFRKLRNGDRFWFERNDPVTGFTEAQLNEIKKTGLSSVICANTYIKVIQKKTFLTPRKSKRRCNTSFVSCDTIPQMDLSQWKAS